uniref:Outer membrane protein beta-barrel domain-containing protein n=1 Tax=Chryseobacterium endophyticum TaxID=1854762 RepID=A0AAU6WKC0_9FLAO
MRAQRITDYMTWSSPNAKHSTVLGLEAGRVEYPDSNNSGYQMKILGNYNYKWFNFNMMYQYGSYFLSEYAFSKVFSENTTYKKISLSAFVNENFFDQKLSMSSGANYTDDIFTGNRHLLLST